MPKDKKKKKDKKDGGTKKIVKKIQALSENRLVADVVAAALVATASALKDSKKARRLATEAGDELTKLSKAGAEQGNALWEMALQIGRRSLDALSAEAAPKRAETKTGRKKSTGKKPSTPRKSR